MTEREILREALARALRGVNVAKLGLAIDGVQHAKLQQIEQVISAALAASPASKPDEAPNVVALIERLRAHDMGIAPDWTGPDGGLNRDKWCDVADDLIREAADTIASQAVTIAELRAAVERAAEDERDRIFEKADQHSMGMPSPYRHDARIAATWLKMEEGAMLPADRDRARARAETEAR